MSEAVPLSPRQRDMYRFGFGVFLFSEGMIFLTVFSTRFVLAGTSRPAGLDQGLAAALTALVLLSVLPALDAWRAAGRGDAAALRSSLLLTGAIGVLLLAGVAWEWSALDVSSASRFGGVFLTALGLHAAHVAAGVLALGGLAASAARGRFSAGNHFAVEAGVLFWLFVVGVWVALYATFYLV